MKKWVSLLCCLWAVIAVAQTKTEVWVWKDSNGVTHYTDRPVDGAKKLEFTTSHPSAPPPATAEQPRSVAAGANAPAAVKYRSLEIWQPENGETFFGADTVVNVRIRMDPDLADGDNLLLYLDGKLVEGPKNSTDYDLTNIDRGVHSVTSVITDAKGSEKIRSEPRVFHIRQATIIAPKAVGPSVRPPARPQPR